MRGNRSAPWRRRSVMRGAPPDSQSEESRGIRLQRDARQHVLSRWRPPPPRRGRRSRTTARRDAARATRTSGGRKTHCSWKRIDELPRTRKGASPQLLRGAAGRSARGSSPRTGGSSCDLRAPAHVGIRGKHGGQPDGRGRSSATQHHVCQLRAILRAQELDFAQPSLCELRGLEAGPREARLLTLSQVPARR